MVPAASGGIPRVPPYSGTARTPRRFGYGAFTLSGQPFQAVPLASPRPRGRPYNPGTRLWTPPVWAVPLSIASTRGIVVTFFSCGYLDVSVPRVRLRAARGWRDRSRRVAPFGYPRINGHLPLPAAFRSLSRPSSPPRAQASPMRPSDSVVPLPESGILLPNSGVHSAPRAFSAYLGSLVVSSSGRPAHPRRRPRDLRFASSMSMSFLRGASRTNPGRPAGSVFLSVENNGFEPLTPCLQSRCSSQLS